MYLIRNTFYSKDTSGLVFEVLKVYSIHADYIKVKGRLWGKDTRILYETKNYKLKKKLISDWKPIIWS